MGHILSAVSGLGRPFSFFPCIEEKGDSSTDMKGVDLLGGPFQGELDEEGGRKVDLQEN